MNGGKFTTKDFIPCSERLPDVGVPVLTFDGQCFSVERRLEWIFIVEEGRELEGNWWIDGYDGDEYDPVGLRDGAAISWMPLPTIINEVQKYATCSSCGNFDGTDYYCPRFGVSCFPH